MEALAMACCQSERLDDSSLENSTDRSDSERERTDSERSCSSDRDSGESMSWFASGSLGKRRAVDLLPRGADHLKVRLRRKPAAKPMPPVPPGVTRGLAGGERGSAGERERGPGWKTVNSLPDSPAQPRPAAPARRVKQCEPLVLRIEHLPLHAGDRRGGSLRVIVDCEMDEERSGAAARVVALGCVASARDVCEGAQPASPKPACCSESARTHRARVAPLTTPFAISLLRHNTVFASGVERSALQHAPTCIVCGDPAEVFALTADAPNPVHQHLVAQGCDAVALLERRFSPSSRCAREPLLRVCRKGCLTYEVFEQLAAEEEARPPITRAVTITD